MKYLWIKDHTHKKGHNIGNLFSNVFFKRCVYVHVCIYMYMHMCVHIHTYIWASLVTQMVKNLPAMQGIRVQSLGQEDPLEKGMATQSSILAWEIPWTEEPGRLQSMGSQRVGHNWATKHFHVSIKVTYLEDISNPWSYKDEKKSHRKFHHPKIC